MRRVLAALWGAAVGSIVGAGLFTPVWLAMMITEGSQDFSHIESMVGRAALYGAILAGTVACACSPAVARVEFQAGAIRGAVQTLLLISGGIFLFISRSRPGPGFPDSQWWVLFFLLLVCVGLPVVAFGCVIGGVRGWHGRGR